MADQKIMKDLGLNEPIAIIAPAHIWLTAMAGYAEIEWNSSAMAIILVKVQEALMDPLYLNERLAQHQQQHDVQEAAMRMFTGQQPDIPPNQEGLEDEL